MAAARADRVTALQVAFSLLQCPASGGGIWAEKHSGGDLSPQTRQSGGGGLGVSCLGGCGVPMLRGCPPGASPAHVYLRTVCPGSGCCGVPEWP